VRERTGSARPWSRSPTRSLGEDCLVYDGGFPSLKATVNRGGATRVRIPAAAPLPKRISEDLTILVGQDFLSDAFCDGVAEDFDLVFVLFLLGNVGSVQFGGR